MKHKRLFSVLLTVCMLMSIMTPAFAQNAESYEVSGIVFSYNEAGALVDAQSLEAGKELIAEISVSKTGAEKNLIFALMIYNGDDLWDFNTVTKAVGETGVDFKVKANVPETIEDCYAVAFLWDGIGTMNAITNSAIFPSGTTVLESISVDGKAIEDFDPAVKTYNVTVDAAQVKLPEIEAVPVDSGVKVSIEHNVSVFPGNSVITLTNASGDQSTYTVNYICGEKLVSDITILEDDTIPERFGGGDVESLPAYHPFGFKVGQFAYCDRDNYFVQTVTDESLIGCDYITGGIKWYNGKTPTVEAFTSKEILPWINFTVARAATVNVFHYDNRNENKFTEYGFELTVSDNKEEGFFRTDLNENKKRPHVYKFSKHFEAGERVSIPNSADNDNTYSVIIQYDGFEIPEVPNYTALSSITINGELYQDFNEKVFDITLPIDTAEINKPVVTAEAAFEGASVMVTDPESFPGKTVITVSKRGEEDSVYTITWAPETDFVTDIAITEEYRNFEYEGSNYTTPVPVYYESLEVGSKGFSDRDFLVEAVNGDKYQGKPYLAMPLHWANAHPWRSGVYSSGVKEDWLSFKLNRDATVRILKDMFKEDSNDGLLTKWNYTYEKYNKDIPVTINVTTNDTHPTYEHEFTRTFAAGSIIKVPNLYNGQVFMIVFDFADYGETLEITPEPVPEPEVTTKLTSITVDGAELEGFSSDILTYEAFVDPVVDAAPEVIGVAETEGTEVTVTDPVKFPGKTVITATADGVEPTEYVINWKTENNLVSDITILQDNTIPDEFGGGKVSVMPGYLPGGFEIGAVAYVDRATRPEPTYRVKATTEESFIGCDYITGGIGWYNGSTPTVKAFKSDKTLPWINFTLSRGATVNVLMYRNTHESRFTQYGYELTSCSDTETGYLLTELNDGKQRPHIYKFSKHFNPGERVTIPNALDSDNTYCAVVVYDDYGTQQIVSANETALKTLSIDGVNLSTFVPSVTAYDVSIATDKAEIPVVTAVASNEEASVTVTNPDTFPGQTVITVTKDGAEPTEYVITWVTQTALVTDIAISPDYAKITYNNGSKDVTVTTTLPVYYNSLEVGSKAFADREFLTEEVNGEFLGKPYLAIPLSWQNGQPWRDGIYTANYIEDWLSFKVNRNATVTIIKDSYKTGSNDDRLINDLGFTFKKYTEFKPIVVNVSSNNTHPDYIDSFYKVVNAGDVVTIPNIYNGQVYFVVFDFEGYTQQ